MVTKKLSQAEIDLTSSVIKDYAAALGGEFMPNQEAHTKNATRLGTMFFLGDPWQENNKEIFEKMFSLLRSYRLELYDPQLSQSINID